MGDKEFELHKEEMLSEIEETLDYFDKEDETKR